MDRGGGQLVRLNGTHKGNEFAMAGVILPKRAFGYHRLHKKGYVTKNSLLRVILGTDCLHPGLLLMI
jgi:hypothetical protein